MARFVGTKVEFGADTDRVAFNIDASTCRLFTLILVHDLLLKYCEAAGLAG